MSAFFDHFETLIEAPGGIKKLRQLILQLAVMGKLVPQDPNDEPASVLLEKIKKEKEQLIKEGKIKNQKSLPVINEEEKIFSSPFGWKWTRLQNISVYIQRGRSPKYVDKSNIAVVSQKCIQWKGFDIKKVRFIDPNTIKNYVEERFLREGDLLWNSTGTGTIGRINVFFLEKNIFDKIVADSHVTVIRPLYIEPLYLNIFLSSHFVQDFIEIKASGSTKQIELNTSVIRSHVIPIPPINEQKRIVAKVNVLMKYCDELESKKEERERVRWDLNNSLLDRLLSVKSEEDFRENWQHLLTHFDILYNRPENVEKLKQAILQLGVMGKLVGQNPEDEPASVLLEKIKKEKEQLIKEGKIKWQKPLPPIKEQEKPFNLPIGWEWVYLNTLCLEITDGTHVTPTYVSKGIPFLSVKDISGGIIDFSNTKFISEKEHLQLINRCFPEYGDILLTKIGTTGIAKAINVKREFSIFVSLALLKISKKYLHPFFIEHLLNSPLVRRLSKKGTEGVGNKNLVLKKIKYFIIPLPPLQEQKRIVAKVESLLALCDKLSDSLQKADSTGEKIFQSIVHQILDKV